MNHKDWRHRKTGGASVLLSEKLFTDFWIERIGICRAVSRPGWVKEHKKITVKIFAFPTFTLTSVDCS
jgi:hypothetical protein